MPRGVRKAITYTGKAAAIYEKVRKLESELKATKDELKIAYKEQIKAEKEAAKKALKADEAKLLKAIKESGKTAEEILAMLSK